VVFRVRVKCLAEAAVGEAWGGLLPEGSEEGPLFLKWFEARGG